MGKSMVSCRFSLKPIHWQMDDLGVPLWLRKAPPKKIAGFPVGGAEASMTPPWPTPLKWDESHLMLSWFVKIGVPTVRQFVIPRNQCGPYNPYIQSTINQHLSTICPLFLCQFLLVKGPKKWQLHAFLCGSRNSREISVQIEWTDCKIQGKKMVCRAFSPKDLMVDYSHAKPLPLQFFSNLWEGMVWHMDVTPMNCSLRAGHKIFSTTQWEQDNHSWKRQQNWNYYYSHQKFNRKPTWMDGAEHRLNN